MQQHNPPDHNLTKPFERLNLSSNKSPWDSYAGPKLPSFPAPNPRRPGQQLNPPNGFEYTPMASSAPLSAPFMMQQQQPQHQHNPPGNVWGTTPVRPMAPTSSYDAHPTTGSLFSTSTSSTSSTSSSSKFHISPKSGRKNDICRVRASL